MWWQGEENAPEIVKLCLASIRRHCGSHKFIVITKDNYQEYLNFPEYIIPKVKAGYISFTHLSDIVRMNLLAKYGGLWIDSTMFAAEDLPDEIFETEYYTIKYIHSRDVAFPKCKWTSFLFAAKHSNRLFPSFMSEMFSEYLKTHNRFIEYFMLDRFIAIAFNTFQDFYDAWSKIPYNNSDWQCLHTLYLAENKEWNAEEFSALTDSTVVFKLTYKRKYAKKTADGKDTFYGHMLSEYGLAE